MKTKIIWSLLGAVVLLVAALTVLSLAHNPTPPALSCLGVSTLSNTSRISIEISNHSRSSVAYLVADPVLKSNGVWETFRFPTGELMLWLLPGQSATDTVTALSVNGEARVPVLWSVAPSPIAMRWFQIRQVARRTLRRLPRRGGGGALYTNYVSDIKL